MFPTLLVVCVFLFSPVLVSIVPTQYKIWLVGITQLFQRGINPFDELGLELVAPQRVVGDAVKEQIAHVDAEERFGEWCRRLRHLMTKRAMC